MDRRWGPCKGDPLHGPRVAVCGVEHAIEEVAPFHERILFVAHALAVRGAGCVCCLHDCCVAGSRRRPVQLRTMQLRQSMAKMPVNAPVQHAPTRQDRLGALKPSAGEGGGGMPKVTEWLEKSAAA